MIQPDYSFSKKGYPHSTEDSLKRNNEAKEYGRKSAEVAYIQATSFNYILKRLFTVSATADVYSILNFLYMLKHLFLLCSKNDII